MSKTRLSVDEYINGVLNRDKVILGRAITLIESNNPLDQQLSFQVMEKLMPHTGNSIRIGITGIPGVGKSTFIEEFGTFLTEKENMKVAVLAVDPSSHLSKGSILGDKTRMERLSVNENAFIRPSPASLTLGGVTARSREVMLLCEAAGYDVVFVETVGVGQSETMVQDMVDFFLLLMLAGTGDDLQGIKRGILEVSDLVVINKADGDGIKKAEEARKQLEMALHLFRPSHSGFPPKVLTCSALQGVGIDKIWREIEEYAGITKNSGFFDKRRKLQNVKWMHESINQELSSRFYQKPGMREKIVEIEKDVTAGKISPQQAARFLLEFGDYGIGKLRD